MKRSRAWRISQTERVVDNRLKFLKETDKNRVKYFEDERNRLAGKHPCDCGHTDCGVCHGHKLPGCASKWKDEHALLEDVIRKESFDDVNDD